MRNSTINVWTKNEAIIYSLQGIEKRLKIQIQTIDCITDLIAMPGFINIVDGFIITDNIIDGLNPFVKNWNKKDTILLLVGKKFRIIDNNNISKFVKFIPDNDQSTLEGIIKYRMNLKFNKSKDDILKSKIHRIIFIYDALRRGVTVRTEDLCDIFDVSDRTIRRDFKILSEVLDEKISYDKDGGFFIG